LITVRPETPADHATIAAVVGAAFGSDTEVLLVERIRASPEYIADLALVAELDGEVVGHVMISGTTLVGDGGERTIVMLSPLAVAPAHQRTGAGSALVRAAVAGTDERGEPLLIVEGDPAYYGRFGFEHARVHGIEIEVPDWAPSEAGQVMLLSSYRPDDPTLRGTVVYPAAFDGLE
jgi:putative acetyltransferase